jgi:carboxyl-terminal processing protease
MKRNKALRVAGLMLALTVAYGLGYTSRSTVQAQSEDTSPYPELAVFARVLSHIERSYVDPVASEDLIYGAIKGMVSTLDPHSGFLTPEEFARQQQMTRGEYVGVGVNLSVREGQIVVVAPIEGGPAFEAGIQTGDIIHRVDGQSVRGLSVDEVVEMLRGEVGVPVDVTIERVHDDGIVERVDYTLIRDQIRYTAVRSDLIAPGYGLVSISQFQRGVSTEVVTAIDELVVESGGELDGLILDLRNNPGGLLSEGIATSDIFLDEGLVVSTEGRNADENEFHDSHDGTTRYEGPLVVLINRGSASASEIVAGALQDRGRAVLLGTRSFGKATVQSIFDFEDGSGLKLTVARYYTPNHRLIHGQGLEPDREVPPGDVSDAELEAGLAEHAPNLLSPTSDRQVLTALDVLTRPDIADTAAVAP